MTQFCLKLSLWLISKLASSNDREYLSGDLQEEFTQEVLPKNNKLNANLWLFKQVSNIGYHAMIKSKNIVATVIAVASLSVFLLLFVAVSWLSNLSDVNSLRDVTWQGFINGSSHLTFFDPEFWTYFINFSSKSIASNLLMLVDIRAFIYSVLALFILQKTNTKYGLSIGKFSVFGIGLMLLPYLLGTIIFLTQDLAHKQSGPVIATMWLSIFYMVLPIGFGVIKKLTTNQDKLIRNN